MAFAKFQENWFRIDGEIAENHAILVNLTASITITYKRVYSLNLKGLAQAKIIKNSVILFRVLNMTI